MGHSYFTDTSRDGYDDQKTATHGSVAYRNASNNDNPDDLDTKQYPSEHKLSSSSCATDLSTAESASTSKSLIDDDQKLMRESTYLTDENQKSFFPDTPSTQAAESVYHVETLVEGNRELKTRSAYFTEENQGIMSSKPISSTPKSDDSKPRRTSMDESASTRIDGMCSKSADDLMAEVMRIAREQEE